MLQKAQQSVVFLPTFQTDEIELPKQSQPKDNVATRKAGRLQVADPVVNRK